MKTISERRIRNNRIRRMREMRRHVLISLLTSFLIISLSLCLSGFRSEAQGSDAEIFYKYYKSMEVQAGDSLWNYAEEYCQEGSYQEYIEEVVEMNHLRSEEITAGQYVIIPYYSTEFSGTY